MECIEMLILLENAYTQTHRQNNFSNSLHSEFLVDFLVY